MKRGTTAASVTGPLQVFDQSRLVGFAWAALTVTTFSGWFVVTRFSVTRDLGIWDVTALRFGIGAILLAPAIVRRDARLPMKAWGNGLVFMMLWGVPFVMLVAYGLSLTSAAQAAAIAPTLMPVFAGIFASLFLREAQGRWRWTGYFAIVLGLIWLVGASTSAGMSSNWAGIGALIAAAAMWAIYTLLFRNSGLTSIQSAALICVWSAILFIPIYVVLGLGRLSLAQPGEIVLQAIYQGGLMSGVAIVTFNRAVSLLGPAAATAVIALIPAVATVLAIPILHEHPTVAQCAAVLTIVVGVLLAAKRTPTHTVSPVVRSHRSTS